MANESNPPSGNVEAAQTQPGEVGPGYEVRDTNVRAIVMFIAGLFALMLVVEVGLWGLLGSIKDEKSSTFVRPDVRPVAVVDQAQQAEEFGIVEQRKQLRHYESEVLAGKAPAGERSAKSVLPIERAIDILSERGIPPTPGPAKTEAEVNSHSGIPAPAAATGTKGDKR
jgi:hypothetical protein